MGDQHHAAPDRARPPSRRDRHAGQETRNGIPNVGYAAVQPIATIAKILAVQLLLAVV